MLWACKRLGGKGRVLPLLLRTLLLPGEGAMGLIAPAGVHRLVLVRPAGWSRRVACLCGQHAVCALTVTDAASC